jgi:hypothetical protein
MVPLADRDMRPSRLHGECVINTTTTSSSSNGGTDSPATLPTNTTVSKVNVSQIKAKVEAQFTALVNGINTMLTDVTQFLFASGTLAKADLVSKFSDRIAAAEKTKAARLALHAAVADEEKVAAAVAPYRTDLRAYLVSRFGKGSPTLQVFGFTPAKATQKTAASKATSAAKAKATRAGIGTKGKKQRKLAAKAFNETPTQPQAPAPSPAAPAPAAPVAKPGAVS